MKERIYNLTIFLMKDYIHDYKACIKDEFKIEYKDIKAEFGIEGKIGLIDKSINPPRWKDFLQSYTDELLNISDNTSNKAIMIVYVKNRIMVLTFGYGRSFLKEECIERNFGFMTALNILDPKKIRGVNAAKIEDVVVQVQKQSSYSTSQEEFDLNTTHDIMMSVVGKAQDPTEASSVSGKDSLQVSVEMSPENLKEKLEIYLDAYNSKNYRAKGFAWIDNIKEVRDSGIKESLDFCLEKQIEECSFDKIQITPPDSLDWNNIKGFAFSGMGDDLGKNETFNMDIKLEDYLKCIKFGSKICQKLRRDKLLVLDNNDTPWAISSVFSSLTTQVVYNGTTYILYNGRWFCIEKNFYKHVREYVSRIPVSEIVLPDCMSFEDEDMYNKRIVNQNEQFCLMDKNLIGVEGGSRKIEACDVFTTSKQFLHVKNKCRSSQLSHLFAQGRVSAECFISDEAFRKQVSDLVCQKFGKPMFDYAKKPMPDEYEIIYVILDQKCGKIEDRLPFFSLVNLMLTVQGLEVMHMKYSIRLVKKG